jgi:hypothetical protein
VLPARRDAVDPEQAGELGHAPDRIPGATAKDKENRRIPFNPNGRLAAILKRRATRGSEAYVFGATHGAYQPMIQTGWETLKLLANGLELKGRTTSLPRRALPVSQRIHASERPAVANCSHRPRLAVVEPTSRCSRITCERQRKATEGSLRGRE